MPYIVFMVLVIILNIIYVKNYKIIRNFGYRLSIKIGGNELKRDIDKIYSPSVVSYLYNQNTELKKDLISDILNLYARKIIDIKQKSNGEYNIVLDKNEYRKENIYYKNNILENDMYIIDTIVLKKCNFKYEEWQEKIKRVYREHILKNVRNERQRNFERYIVQNQLFLFIRNTIISYNCIKYYSIRYK